MVEHIEHCDVCIVGAGWSGLLAARHLTEHGLSVILLERREALGGVWRYSPDPDVISVMRSTITSSSACVTEASDHPMDPAIGNFVSHADVLGYLEGYARRFGLVERVRFGREVLGVERRDARERWRVRTNAGDVRARFLVVATGRSQRLRPPPAVLRGFTGELIHSGQVKHIEPDSYAAEDNVLVYGGGETASDIVERLVDTPARVTWAIADGQHFFRKASRGLATRAGVYAQTDSPLDEASSRCIQLISPFHRSKPGMRWLCLLGSSGLRGYEGHGIPAWYKGVPFMTAFVNKNGHVVEHVASGRVRARGAVTAIDGREVEFADGARERFSHVITCTGYAHDLSFLPPDLASVEFEGLYKLIFEPDDPTLAFIGYARPNVSSIPLMTEIQCFLLARVFSGRVELPPPAQLRAVADADRRARDRFFNGLRRPDGLVHCFDYGYDVAELAGVRPDYWQLLRADPAAWLKTFFAPANSAQFRLGDPATRGPAVEQIWRRQKPKYYVYPLIYLVARALMVDSFVDLWHGLMRANQGSGGGAGT